MVLFKCYLKKKKNNIDVSKYLEERMSITENRASALVVDGEASESEDETLNSGHSSPVLHLKKLV